MFLVIFFDVVAVKRIETVKNRVKTELEISMQIVDVKRQKFAIFLIQNIKNFNKLLLNGSAFPTFGVFLTGAKTTF